MYFLDNYPIIEKKAIAADIYSFTIKCPEVAAVVQFGQFVHIQVEGNTLRRPISICDFDRENGTIRIVFEIRGEGTEKIAELREDDLINMIAPLGKGFTLPKNADENTKVALVGGGIGVPPLLSLARHYGANADAILGFRSFDKVILAKDFEALGSPVTLCTDDGSAGNAGTVMPCFEAIINEKKIDLIYTCGPLPMIKAVVAIAHERDIPCQVSLEERMGCGVGACLVCVCKINRANKDMNLRVCKDGPVFNSKEVVF